MRKNPRAVSLGERLDRELERARRERTRNDEERTGKASGEDFRIKDARANPAAAGVRRLDEQ